MASLHDFLDQEKNNFSDVSGHTYFSEATGHTSSSGYVVHR